MNTTTINKYFTAIAAAEAEFAAAAAQAPSVNDSVDSEYSARARGARRREQRALKRFGRFRSASADRSPEVWKQGIDVAQASASMSIARF